MSSQHAKGMIFSDFCYLKVCLWHIWLKVQVTLSIYQDSTYIYKLHILMMCFCRSLSSGRVFSCQDILPSYLTRVMFSRKINVTECQMDIPPPPLNWQFWFSFLIIFSVECQKSVNEELFRCKCYRAMLKQKIWRKMCSLSIFNRKFLQYYSYNLQI